MANEKNQQGGNLFTALRRLFSSDVIIRNEGGKMLKVVDTNDIQNNGVIPTNSLVDRFNKVYTTSTAYGVNLNLAQNYRSARVQIYADYDAMDTDAIISSALDIISDECTLKNEQGEVLQIRSSDENIQKILYNLFYSVLNIEYSLWGWIRNMCKYGDFYLKLEIAEGYGVYNVIPFSAYNIAREEGFNPKNANEVRFKFDPTAAIASTGGYSSVSREDEQGIFFDNYEMAHFRLTGDVNYLPYGRSYLEPARKLFKQYVLIEDAMLIHRIVRAPEKRVFYVNIGAIPPGEVENFMQRMISKMKKTPLMDPQTGQYNLKYNMQNMLEDIYIPVRGNDATTRIDTAKGLDYNGIEDVQYFREKLFAALKIPKAFMGYEKDLTGKATLAAEDIRFARTIERIQRIILSELTKVALIHLYSNGYTNESAANFTISLTNPSIIYEQERIALFKEKIDLANTALEAKLLPKDFIYDKIFQFSEDQYAEMEDMIIEDQKKAFRYNQILEEGNDPAETGQAFGTPHQLASLYGGKGQTKLDVPTGYDETNPSEPSPQPGRPQVHKSIRGTDKSALGRDPLGKGDLSAKTDSKEDYSSGMGAPLALENSMSEYLKLRSSLEKMKGVNPKNVGRKTMLFEQSDAEGRTTDLYSKPDLLKETSLLDDSDLPTIERKAPVLPKPSAPKPIFENKQLVKKEEVVDTPETLLEHSKILSDSAFVVPTTEKSEQFNENEEIKLSRNLLDESKILPDLNLEIQRRQAPIQLNEEKQSNDLSSSEIKEIITLLNEDSILDDTTFNDIDKTVPENLLNEVKIEDDGIFRIPERKPAPVTLLNSDNIILDDTFEDQDLIKVAEIMNENSINEDVKYDNAKKFIEESIELKTTLNNSDNIIEESIFDEIKNKSNNIISSIPENLLNSEIVSEEIFDELHKINTTDKENLINNDESIIEEEVFDKLDESIPVNLLKDDKVSDDTTFNTGMLDESNLKDETEIPSTKKGRKKKK